MSDFNSEEDNLKPILKEIVKEKNLGYINLNQVAIISKEKQKVEKNRKIYAECIRATGREKFFTNLVYVVVVYPAFFSLDEKFQEIILWHELLHIGEEFDGSLRSHDVEEFFEIIPVRYKKELGAYF